MKQMQSLGAGGVPQHKRFAHALNTAFLAASFAYASIVAGTAIAADVQLMQEGDLNIVSALQTSGQNGLSVVQKGGRNVISALQSGKLNKLSLQQFGPSNSISTRQQGFMAVNFADVTQTSATSLPKSFGGGISHQVIIDGDAVTYVSAYRSGGLDLVSLTPFAPGIGVMGRAH